MCAKANALSPADRLGREWAYVHAGGHGPAEPGDVGGGAGQVVVNGNGSCRGQIGSEFVQSPALAAFRPLEGTGGEAGDLLELRAQVGGTGIA